MNADSLSKIASVGRRARGKASFISVRSVINSSRLFCDPAPPLINFAAKVIAGTKIIIVKINPSTVPNAKFPFFIDRTIYCYDKQIPCHYLILQYFLLQADYTKPNYL